nr:RNA pseudouridine synthase [Mycoplasmopsis bovis]
MERGSVTYVHLLKTFYIDNKPYSLVKCELETGRTHQIRVHLAYIKHPVYGDNIYGSHVDDFNQRLHAYRLRLHTSNFKKTGWCILWYT